MTGASGLRIGIVAGEESGDLLAADLVRAIAALSGREVELLGVGGSHLAELGLRSLFDPKEIAIVGIGGVLTQLPRIARRLGQATRALADARLDCLVTVDVPDFSLRVASRVRRARPGLPVIHYVCPSVWAWRPGRAKTMTGFVDHVLCILPFEPVALARLGGPPGTYVGHRLTHDPGVLRAAARQLAPRREGGGKTLMLLPGSRRGEVTRLLPDFERTVAVVASRGGGLRVLLPTLPHLKPLLEGAVSGWPVVPRVTDSAEDKWRAFSEADAALIASGTVSLELALSRVPHVSTYRLDPVGRRLKGMITSWSASLPNLVADRPVVPEFFDEAIRPAALARHVEALWEETPMRRWQRDGFEAVAAAMAMEKPAGEAAAEVVLGVIAGEVGTRP